MTFPAADALDQAFREQWCRVLAVLVGLLGDVDVAEEAAQEAFAVAAERWPREGPPASPAAWLVTTARNRAIDRVRRDRAIAAKTALLRAWRQGEEEVEVREIPDERLELLFARCHRAEDPAALTYADPSPIISCPVARCPRLRSAPGTRPAAASMIR